MGCRTAERNPDEGTGNLNGRVERNCGSPKTSLRHDGGDYSDFPRPPSKRRLVHASKHSRFPHQRSASGRPRCTRHANFRTDPKNTQRQHSQSPCGMRCEMRAILIPPSQNALETQKALIGIKNIVHRGQVLDIPSGVRETLARRGLSSYSVTPPPQTRVRFRETSNDAHTSSTGSARFCKPH